MIAERNVGDFVPGLQCAPAVPVNERMACAQQRFGRIGFRGILAALADKAP